MTSQHYLYRGEAGVQRLVGIYTTLGGEITRGTTIQRNTVLINILEQRRKFEMYRKEHFLNERNFQYSFL